MKKLLTHFSGLAVFAFVLLFSSQVGAQGTHLSEAQGLIIRLKSGGVDTDYRYGTGNCGYGTTSNPPAANNPAWGGTVGSNFCAPVAWAYGLNQDTFGCSALPAGSLTGKVALVRRGPFSPPNTACSFTLKAYNAQNAGAVAVIIANHNGNAADNDCTVLNMPRDTAGGLHTLVTIPVYSVGRTVANQIDAAIRSAGGAELCFLRPDVSTPDIYLPTASKRTPAAHIPVDTLGFAAYLTNNSGNELINMELKAEVLDATNNVLHSTSIVLPTFAAGIADSFVVISQGQFAPELPVGEYTVRYSTTHANAQLDSRKETKFYVTNNLYSNDDGATVAYQPNPAADYAVATMYTLNPKVTDKYMVKTVQFVHGSDPATLPTQDINANLYLFKVKDNVNFNVAGSFVFDAGLISPSFDWLGTANYDAPVGAVNYANTSVDLVNISTGDFGIEVENGKRYVVAIEYSGNSRNVFQGFDEDAVIGSPSTLVYWPPSAGAAPRWYTGGLAAGLNATLRMFLDLVSTTDENKLPESSMQIRPNPIVETLNLQVSLEAATDVTVTIADLTGRVITYEVREGFSNGLLTYQLPQLASGTYLARIATKEGTLTKKFIVQK